MILKNNITMRMKAIGIGLVVGSIVTVFAALMTSALIYAEKIEEDKVVYGITISLILGSFMGASASALKTDEKKMIICIISGAMYLITLLCLTACFFGGRYENVRGTIILVMGSTMASALIAMRSRRNNTKLPTRRVRLR